MFEKDFKQWSHFLNPDSLLKNVFANMGKWQQEKQNAVVDFICERETGLSWNLLD